MNDAVAHMPFSSEGHIGVMTDDTPSTNACGHLDQLQVQKVLQCGSQVVCPEGLNGGLEALLFDFKGYCSGMQPPQMNPPKICP